VELSLFNLQGQLVRQVVAEVKEAGSYEVSWDGTDEQGRPVASGIYLSRLKAGRFSQIRKMMFMK